MKEINVPNRKRHFIICNMSLVLLQFLIKKGVLHEFVTNCVNYYYTLSYGDRKDYDDYRMYESTIESFDWSTTKEGGFFWNDVDLRYRDYLRDNKL